jgi:hypothetical protein
VSAAADYPAEYPGEAAPSDGIADRVRDHDAPPVAAGEAVHDPVVVGSVRESDPVTKVNGDSPVERAPGDLVVVRGRKQERRISAADRAAVELVAMGVGEQDPHPRLKHWAREAGDRKPLQGAGINVHQRHAGGNAVGSDRPVEDAHAVVAGAVVDNDRGLAVALTPGRDRVAVEIESDPVGPDRERRRSAGEVAAVEVAVERRIGGDRVAAAHVARGRRVRAKGHQSRHGQREDHQGGAAYGPPEREIHELPLIAAQGCAEPTPAGHLQAELPLSMLSGAFSAAQAAAGTSTTPCAIRLSAVSAIVSSIGRGDQRSRS